MYLKRLELSGFKSFAKKKSLDFTTAVTAVVGPNGSGKSNIVESIRFVLGEQSIKSLRGKSGSDLIFKGSNSASALSRASVSIIFDNQDKIFAWSGADNNPANLSYDEIAIGREVFADGSNRYSVNGIEVRLKDVIELLSSVNIGASGHHIISQGEADRILSANNKERRSMIEDALGLKVFQYKIKEALRKLDKTAEHMKEAGILKREIQPHLNFLKKQVEKIEKSRELREELRRHYGVYLSQEQAYIKREQNVISSEQKEIEYKLSEVLSSLDSAEQLRGQKNSLVVEDESKYNAEIVAVRTAIDDLSRRAGRLEGMLESLEQQALKEEVQIADTINSDAESASINTVKISFSEIEDFFSELQNYLQEVLTTNDLGSISGTIEKMQNRLAQFLEQKSSSSESVRLQNNSSIEASVKNNQKNENIDHTKEKNEQSLRDLQQQQESIQNDLADLRQKEKTLQGQVLERRVAREKEFQAQQHNERNYYELINRRNGLNAQKEMLAVRSGSIDTRATAFENEIREGAVLVGPEYVRFTSFEDELPPEFLQQQENLHRTIERLKIKIEDAGMGSGLEIIKEYEETCERDTFLANELDDLSHSIQSLKDLIFELKSTLNRQFKEGITKINSQFGEFFSLMFDGGNAFLSLVAENRRDKKNQEDNLADMTENIMESSAGSSTENNGEAIKEMLEDGIEINVSMPHKKVKELAMLSGGERSLTSIALLFAISQVNPPPFLVLDETDAALDEANSRKYGDMLDTLSKYSQLIVVTHNRETMSRAQVLYGITIGNDGASKLLSIKFAEAAAIAK